jgi:hypothetical protein
MVEQEIIQVLTAGSPLPTAAGNNVYALVLPDNSSLPAITFQRISSTPVNDLSGHSGLDQVRMQIDCWSRTYGGAKALAAQVRALMTEAGFKALLATDRDDYESDTQIYRSSTDYMVWQK